MKNKITSLLAGVALFGATADADIAIADGLSAYGYIDLVAVDLEGADRISDLVEYEIGLSFTPAESQWSAVAELSYGEIDSGASLETVAVTYQYSDALSFTAGQVYTFQGLESNDAPNNDFISYSGRTVNGESTDLYAADYAEGIAASYSVGDITIAAWAQASANASFQYYASYSGVENLTLSAALIDYDTITNLGDSVNLMATYQIGDFTISAENVDTDNTLDITSVAVAYGLGDTTIAVRAVDGDYNGTDFDKTSIAAFYALSDNVAVGAEFSDEEFGGDDTKGVAVELLYVF